MQYKLPHGLTNEAVRAQLDKAAVEFSRKFPKHKPTLTWKDKAKTQAQVTFKALGSKVEVDLQLEEEAVLVSAQLPFLLRPFGKKAEQVVRSQVAQWLQGSQDSSKKKRHRKGA